MTSEFVSEALITGGAAIALRWIIQGVKGLKILDFIPDDKRPAIIQMLVIAASIIFCVVYDVDLIEASTGQRTFLGPFITGFIQVCATTSYHDHEKHKKEKIKLMKAKNEENGQQHDSSTGDDGAPASSDS